MMAVVPLHSIQRAGRLWLADSLGDEERLAPIASVVAPCVEAVCSREHADRAAILSRKMMAPCRLYVTCRCHGRMCVTRSVSARRMSE
jgi:hypothetical protein